MIRLKERSLDRWLAKKSRKPLILRGARQVGKSTLVEQFAERKGLNLHLVNLERHRGLNEVFGSFDIPRILSEIQYICRKGSPTSPGSLLFLDEIQAAPQALAALRYFYEEVPDLPVIAAGSLLEFTLSKHNFSMPVGRVEYLFMGPMTFTEFLMAYQEDELLHLLESYELGTSFPETAHSRLLELLRQYLLIGGMPEAVKSMIENQDFREVMEVHSSILETYQDDFSKYCTDRQLLLVQKVFDRMPRMIGDKIKYSRIDMNVQSRDLKIAIDLLSKAGVLTRVVHSTGGGIPLKASENDRVCKAYFLDCGLLNRSCRIEQLNLEEMVTARFINEGNLAEQFVCQHLLATGYEKESPRLHYWLREKKGANSEVDFILQHGQDVVPIEVKSGRSGSLRSLHQFILSKDCKAAIRFDTNPPSKQRVRHQVLSGSQDASPIEFDLISLPLYMVEQWSRILD